MVGEEKDQHFLDALQETYGDRAGNSKKQVSALAIHCRKSLQKNKRWAVWC